MAGDFGWKPIVRSAKADFLSLTCFEIGLFGWMAIFDFLIRSLEVGDAHCDVLVYDAGKLTVSI